MKQVLEWILKPFKEEYWFLLIVWVLSAAPVIVFCCEIQDFPRAFNFCSKSVVVSYLLTLMCSSFKPIVSKVLKIIVVILCVISLIIDTGMFEVCRIHFQNETVAIILGTNIEEAGGFIDTYLTPNVVLIILCSLLLSLMVFIFKKGIQKISQKLWPVFVSIFALSIPFSIHNFGNTDVAGWKSVSVLKIFLFASYEKTKDLCYQSPAPLVFCGENAPANIILVLGESHSRSHCSLYGYEKQTEPMMEDLARKDSLLVFPDVTAAYYHTIESFKLMFSEMNEGDSEDDLYRSFTIFDYLRALGYHTSWISNQSSAGIYDNMVTKFANLADTTVFVGKYGMGFAKRDYDGIICPVFHSFFNSSTSKKEFYFLHMMGQHVEYSLRCPEEEKVFHLKDYPDRLEHQREILADYDNAVLYNDSILARIIDMAKNADSILLYVPDHGQDIYESDPYYAGHSRAGNAESIKFGESIPFLIYCSAQFRDLHPETYRHLLEIKDIPFNTSDLIPLILSICDINK